MAHRKSPARLRKASCVAHVTALSRQNAPPPHESLARQTLASLEGAITGTSGLQHGAAGLASIQSLLAFPRAQLLVDQVGTYADMHAHLENYPYPLPDQPDGTPESKASCYVVAPMPQSAWR